MTRTKLAEKTLTVAGLYAELTEFKKPFAYNFDPFPYALTRANAEVSGEKSDFSLQRAKRKIFLIAKANQTKNDVFVTFTFAKNVKDLEYSNREFCKFIQRLSFHLKTAIQYIAVPEFQKRGAVHYHAIFFNFAFIKKAQLAKIWRHGFVKINLIQKDYIPQYIVKYLHKNAVDSRLFARHVYLSSRNLVRPYRIIQSQAIDSFVSSVTMESVGEYFGTHVTVKKYNIL